MSTRITHQADGTARGQTQQNTANSIIDLRKQPSHTPKQAEPAKPDCCGQPQQIGPPKAGRLRPAAGARPPEKRAGIPGRAQPRRDAELRPQRRRQPRGGLGGG